MILFGDHWYIIVGLLLMGCGMIAVIVITVSTHIIANREAKLTKQKDDEMVERINGIKSKIHKYHPDDNGYHPDDEVVK